MLGSHSTDTLNPQNQAGALSRPEKVRVPSDQSYGRLSKQFQSRIIPSDPFLVAMMIHAIRTTHTACSFCEVPLRQLKTHTVWSLSPVTQTRRDPSLSGEKATAITARMLWLLTSDTHTPTQQQRGHQFMDHRNHADKSDKHHKEMHWRRILLGLQRNLPQQHSTRPQGWWTPVLKKGLVNFKRLKF